MEKNVAEVFHPSFQRESSPSSRHRPLTKISVSGRHDKLSIARSQRLFKFNQPPVPIHRLSHHTDATTLQIFVVALMIMMFRSFGKNALMLYHHQHASPHGPTIMHCHVIIVVVVVVDDVAVGGFVLCCCFPTGVPRTTDHALPNANPLLRVRSCSTHTNQPTNLTKPTNKSNRTNQQI